MADYEEQGKGILGLSPKGSLRCDNQMASNMTRNERDIWDDTSTTSAYFYREKATASRSTSHFFSGDDDDDDNDTCSFSQLVPP